MAARIPRQVVSDDSGVRLTTVSHIERGVEYDTEFVERHRRLTHPGHHESPDIGRINEAAISVRIAAAKSSPAEARARIRRSLLNPDVVRRERAWPP